MRQSEAVSQEVIFIPEKLLRDIKAEILLTFVAELFDTYFKIKNDSKLLSAANFIDNEIIDLSVNEFLEYFNEKVIRKKRLINIFSNPHFNYSNLINVKQYKTHAVYLRKIELLITQSIPKDSNFMPEYFGILLMYYFKTDANKVFTNFDFIQKYDFIPLLNIYEDMNIEIKKKYLLVNPNAKIWEYRTTIDNMEKIALNLTKKYIEFKYKINPTRKSKKR